MATQLAGPGHACLPLRGSRYTILRPYFRILHMNACTFSHLQLTRGERLRKNIILTIVNGGDLTGVTIRVMFRRYKGMLKRNISVTWPLMFTSMLARLIRHGTAIHNGNNLKRNGSFIHVINRHSYHISLFLKSLRGRLLPWQRHHLTTILLRCRGITPCLCTTHLRRGNVK